MLRIAQLACLVFVITTLLMVGALGLYRHRPSNHAWIIFGLGHQLDSGYDIYRMLSDGSQVMQLTSVENNRTKVQVLHQSGRMILEHDVGGNRRFTLLSLTGEQKPLFDFAFASASIAYYYYDSEAQHIYLIGNDSSVSYGLELWVVDLRSGQQAPVPVPADLEQARTAIVDGGYVFWSDVASDGDLYHFQYANPPTVTRLTTRGDVLRAISPINQTGWVYFYAGATRPLGPLSLYRMRQDGSAEQLIARPVQALWYAPGFVAPNRDAIYFWGGDAENRHLVRAKPDGSDPTPLPITPISGWIDSWPFDRTWVYVRQGQGDLLDTSNLVRLNLQTGAATTLMETHTFYQVGWTPDKKWLLVLVDSTQGLLELHQLQPDGTESTLLLSDVISRFHILEPPRLLIFERWGRVDLWIHALDMDTMRIYPIKDGLPPNRSRTILATLPMSDLDWQPAWLVGGGVAAIGLGLAAGRWRQTRVRRH